MWHDGQFSILRVGRRLPGLGKLYFYLLGNSEMLKRVREEVRVVMPAGTIDDVCFGTGGPALFGLLSRHRVRRLANVF
jgi:hypothetical protein